MVNHMTQHSRTPKSLWLVGFLVLVSIVMMPLLWAYVQQAPDLHSQVISWNPTNIASKDRAEDFVGSQWAPARNIRVMRIQVWMGNPNNVTWEGDTYVVKNRSNPTAPDSLLAHYQFDKHAESPIPHQLMFDLEPGFKVSSGEMLSVWRRFVNTSPQDTTAGDGEVIIYYVYA